MKGLIYACGTIWCRLFHIANHSRRWRGVGKFGFVVECRRCGRTWQE